ncbi:MAG: outer membrane lipoprotein-sorting protein [Gemmatimonadota bacterium]
MNPVAAHCRGTSRPGARRALRRVTGPRLLPWALAVAAAAAPASPAPAGSGAPPDTLALHVVRRIDAAERVASSHALLRQVVTAPGGEERTLEMEAWTRDHNQRQLMVYTAPQRVAGDRILMLDDGDDIWFYTPRTDRIRHLASHARRQRVQGSDFAYEDLAGGRLEDDYTFTLTGVEEQEGVPCYRLELVPTASGPHYSRLVLWADRDRFLTRRIDYCEDGEVIKRLTTTDLEEVGGQWWPMRMVMENLEEGGRTAMETEKIEFGLGLPDRLFTTGALRRPVP